MNLQIFFNGEDIAGKVDVKSAILTDRYGGLLDSFELSINDKEKVWAKTFSKGDKIAITTDGYTTGNMYIANTEENSELLNIDSISLKPSNKKRKSRIWRHVRLMEVLKDCAKENNLTLKTYGITDYTYESLAQINQTDLEFTSKVCKREGYSIKVDNDCLIVFNEYYMENQNTDLTITPDDVDSNYMFVESDSCVNSVTVICYNTDKGLFEYTVSDANLVGKAETICEKVNSFGEAERFAKGYLRAFNKSCVIGYLTLPYNPGISAGTVLNIKGFNKYDSRYVVSEVSHNIKKEVSKLTIRKALNY